MSKIHTITPSFVRSHWLSVLIIMAAIGGAYWYFRPDAPATIPTTQTKVETVKKGDLKVMVSGSGQIQADSQVDLKPVAAGDAIQVLAVSVKNDQIVKKGQIIATLDSKNAVRNVRQAELSLKSAKIKLQQTKEDFPGRTTGDTLTRRVQETAVKQQEIDLADALSQLAEYTIRAPFDGIVTGLSVDSGDTISQTAILASVITTSMKAVISLNEVDAVKVKVGNSVSLAFDALPNVELGGKISKLDTIGVATQGVVSYGAEIALDEQLPVLRPGMSVAVEISVAEKHGILLVPNAAVIYEDGKAFVLIAASNRRNGVKSGTVEENQANSQDSTAPRGEKKEITVGITDNVNTEVLSGLNAGENVLVAGSAGVTANANPSANQQSQGGLLNLFRGAGGGNRGGGFNR